MRGAQARDDRQLTKPRGRRLRSVPRASAGQAGAHVTPISTQLRGTFPTTAHSGIRFPLAPGDLGLRPRPCGTTGEGGGGPCAPPGRSWLTERAGEAGVPRKPRAWTAQLDPPTPTCNGQPPCARPPQSQGHVGRSAPVTTTNTRPLGVRLTEPGCSCGAPSQGAGSARLRCRDRLHQLVWAPGSSCS